MPAWEHCYLPRTLHCWISWLAGAEMSWGVLHAYKIHTQRDTHMHMHYTHTHLHALHNIHLHALHNTHRHYTHMHYTHKHTHAQTGCQGSDEFLQLPKHVMCCHKLLLGKETYSWNCTVRDTWKLGNSFSWTLSHGLFLFPDFEQHPFPILMPEHKDNFSSSVCLSSESSCLGLLWRHLPLKRREELKSAGQQPALTGTCPNENIWGPSALVELLNVFSCMNKSRKGQQKDT